MNYYYTSSLVFSIDASFSNSALLTNVKSANPLCIVYRISRQLVGHGMECDVDVNSGIDDLLRYHNQTQHRGSHGIGSAPDRNIDCCLCSVLPGSDTAPSGGQEECGGECKAIYYCILR
jgi:hypothetical protein